MILVAMYERTCVGCGVTFRAKAPHAKFHDPTCRKRANRKGTNVLVLTAADLGKLGDSLKPGESIDLSGPTPTKRAKRKGSKTAAAEHVDGVESGDEGETAKLDARLALRRQVIRELTEADRLDTVLGQQAVVLADAICSPFDTGSAKASLSKELSRVMADALKGAKVALSPLDELRLRREQKLSGTA